MNNPPKRNHYIPQFILRNFTDDNGMLHCFNKETGQTFCSSPANVFAMTWLYANRLEDGTVSTQVETELSQIEGKFSGVINKVIEAARSESNLRLEPSDEEELREFINCQITRHPYNLKLLKKGLREPERLQPHIEQNLNRTLSGPERNVLYNAQETDLARNVFLSQINVPDDDLSSWMRALRQGRIGICKVEKNAGEFVIGDRQVVLIPSETGDTNLRNPRVRLLYPISYDVGILWRLRDWEQRPIIFSDSQRMCDINKMAFETSELLIAGRSEVSVRKSFNPGFLCQ